MAGMKVLPFFAGFLAVFVVSFSPAAAQNAPEVGGSIRLGVYGVVPFGKPPPGLKFPPTGIFYDRSRLKLLAQPTDMTEVDVQLDATAAFGDSALRPPSLYGNTAGLGRASLTLGIYRASAALRQGDWDFRAGIQRVAWGVGQLFNPSNIFSHVGFADPTQELPGVPGLVVRRPLGSTGELTLVGAVEPLSGMPQAAAHGVVNVSGIDLGLAGSYSERNHQLLLGWNIKGDAEIGYWSEGRWARNLSRHDSGSWRAESGVDYSFGVADRTLYVSAEYYLRSEGLDSVSRSGVTGLAASLGQAGDEGLLGRHYGYVTARMDVNDDIVVSLSSLGNLSDPSAIVFPYAGFSWIDDLDVYVGAVVPAAPSGSEFNPSSPVGAPKLTVAGLAFCEMHF